MNTPEPSNQLAVVVADNGLDVESAQPLLAAFHPFVTQAEQWRLKVNDLNVTDVSQVKEMKLARECRLALKEIRVNVENTRKKLKEDSLRRGKAIDGLANLLKFLIEPMEERLLAQEQFAERAEAARKAKLAQERAQALTEAGGVAAGDLSLLHEDTFSRMLEDARLAKAARAEAARRAEAERVEREQREAAERRKALEEAEKARVEALKALEEARKGQLSAQAAKAAAQKAQAAAEKAKAEAEAARKKVEAEALAKRQAEEAEQKRKAEAEEKARRKAARAPEADKLRAYAKTVRELQVPAVKSEEASFALTQAIGKIGAALKALEAAADDL